MKISETSMCIGTSLCNKNKGDASGKKILVKKQIRQYTTAYFAQDWE